MRTITLAAALAATLVIGSARAGAEELKVLTAGAMKSVVSSLLPEFEREGGTKVALANDTAGALARRVGAGEPCDVIVLTPSALGELALKGKVVADTRAAVARVGIGAVVKAGAPKPDIGTVESFKRALLAAKSVAYIDPASGGSSGVYLSGLFDRLGIADEIAPKAKLKAGGYVADLVADGTAEIGIHQISEILPVPGVALVGPLPDAVQNYTDYSAAICAGTHEDAQARRFLALLKSPDTKRLIQAKGMVPPP